MRNLILGLTGALVLAGATMAGPAAAQSGGSCHGGASFERWLENFKREAVSQGLPQQAVEAALAGVRFDPRCGASRDRGQGVFQQSFLQFAGRMTGGGRHSNGLRQIKANGRLLSRIEQKIGVPPPVVVALWGLESDYGAVKGGNFNVIRSVATLAYDCRRPDFFRRQLMGAVRIVARGDLRPNQMIGNWAGELGPTQFTPFYYFENGVDFDGDGRVNMISSMPDALASAANLLRNRGWQRGQPWLQEVRVPDRLPWEQADLDIKHPRSQWVKWGVRSATGRPLPADNMPASLRPADGAQWSGLPGLSEFRCLHRLERLVRLCADGGLFRDAARRRARDGQGQRSGGGAQPGPGAADSKAADRPRYLKTEPACGRWYHRFQHPHGGQAAQIKLGVPADSYPSPELLAAFAGPLTADQPCLAPMASLAGARGSQRPPICPPA